MHSRQLDTALSEFAHEAARCLQERLDAGAEVPFDLASQPARGGRAARLYCYTPLTAEFIAAHEPQLARLPGHAGALGVLERFEGLDRYLRARDVEVARGAHRARTQAALLTLLGDVFAEQTTFELRPERLRAALARLERAAVADAADALTLVATLHGLTIDSAELPLTKGLTIAQPDALRGAPAGALAPGEHLLVALTVEQPTSHDSDEREMPPADALAHARAVLNDLLRALRLYGDGRVTLGPLAWARAGGQDAWSTVALGAGGRPHGMLVVSAEQEDELRAFCNLVSRRAPHGDELAWALRRFELGCERASPYEALSDHLLALRALLEPEGPAGGLLAGRIAALCATPEERAKLTKRMLKAQALERAVIAGTAAEHAAGINLARDVADHLRALLRDVICGHLDPNLASLADELLAAPAADAAQQQAVADELAADPRDAQPAELDEDPLAQSALPV